MPYERLRGNLFCAPPQVVAATKCPTSSSWREEGSVHPGRVMGRGEWEGVVRGRGDGSRSLLWRQAHMWVGHVGGTGSRKREGASAQSGPCLVGWRHLHLECILFHPPPSANSLCESPDKHTTKSSLLRHLFIFQTNQADGWRIRSFIEGINGFI